MKEPRRKTIAIASGKGGVGKSSIVSNMAYLLVKMNAKTYVFDANLSLGSIDIMLGVVPRFNIADLIDGSKNMSDIVVEAESGIKLIPATSGNSRLSDLSLEEEMIVLCAIHNLPGFDFLLIDTPSGISSNVIHFAAATDEVWVIVTPDPTSVRDAYATIKVLHRMTARKDFRIFVNKVRDEGEALEVYKEMLIVTDWSYHVSLNYAGYIPLDLHVNLALRKHRLCTQLFPETPATKAMVQICNKLVAEPYVSLPRNIGEALAREL